MPGHARRRYTTYLVALTAERDGAGGPVVYAAMKRSAEEALDAVRALAEVPAGASVGLAVVGSLSTSTAKAIKLKPDEVRAV